MNQIDSTNYSYFDQKFNIYCPTAIENYYAQSKIFFVLGAFVNMAPMAIYFIDPIGGWQVVPLLLIISAIWNLHDGFYACKYAVEQQFRQKAYKG